VWTTLKDRLKEEQGHHVHQRNDRNW